MLRYGREYRSPYDWRYDRVYRGPRYGRDPGGGRAAGGARYDSLHYGGTRGPRLTGMESNRYRGVYGSDYRMGGYNRGEHGGYRGSGANRGGGMNPGRRGW